MKTSGWLWFVIPFCSIFILIGLGLMLGTAAAIIRGVRARSWPTTSGTIQRAELKPWGDSKSMTYEVEVEYRYEVDGTTYTAQRVHPLYTRSNEGDVHRQVAEKLEPGAQVRVYYNPDDPADATLAAGFFSGSLTLVFAGSIFLFDGLTFLLTLVFAFTGQSNFADAIEVLER